MKKFLLISIGAVFLLTVTGCKKETLTPQQMLEGTWRIDSKEFMANEEPGDGSYLVFNACATSCTGTDYDASNGSTGTFTYTMNEEATFITIVDETNIGGDYDATWDILELTNSRFRITATTFFGNVKIEMSKI